MVPKESIFGILEYVKLPFRLLYIVLRLSRGASATMQTGKHKSNFLLFVVGFARSLGWANEKRRTAGDQDRGKKTLRWEQWFRIGKCSRENSSLPCNAEREAALKNNDAIDRSRCACLRTADQDSAARCPILHRSTAGNSGRGVRSMHYPQLPRFSYVAVDKPNDFRRDA